MRKNNSRKALAAMLLLASVCFGFTSCSKEDNPVPPPVDDPTPPPAEDIEPAPTPAEGVVIAEIDWTERTEYLDLWYSDNATVSVVQGEGLIIESNPAEGANYWESQVPMIGHIPAVAEDGQYQVKFTVIAPSAGEIRLDFCSWDGSGATTEWLGEVVEGENNLTVDFPNFPTECTDAMIFYQCGKVPGKHVIKKVQVIDLGGEDLSDDDQSGDDSEQPDEPAAGDEVLAEKDWTGTDDLPWFFMFAGSDEEGYNGSVATDADGIAITVNEKTGQIWLPQAIILDGFDLAEDGNYKVVVVAKFPCDGQLQIEMGSWSESQQHDFPVTATGDFQEIECEFPGFCGDAEDAHVLFQCGEFLGTIIVKSVKVLKLDEAGNETEV